MNSHLISFCSPYEKYLHTKNRFYNEALSLQFFKSINIFSEIDVFGYAKELLTHKKFMESTRAYGFWIWKTFIISELMKSIPDGDIICYTDIGCTFNIGGKNRMKEYHRMVLDKDSLCFDILHLEKEYTKSDTYVRVFPNDESHFHTGQRCSTTYFLKNTKENKSIIDEINVISTESDYHCIDDSASITSNDISFKEHRYDQSIFSLLSKKYNFYCIPDETYWNPDWNVSGKNYPIWATRIR
jgi:hypothetical protein